MSLAILFHFLCAQHVSGINISIVKSLRLFCWITTMVVLFLVRCVLEFRCGWVGVVSVLHASACNTDITQTQPHRNSNTHRTKNNTTNVVIQQNSRKLLTMDILMPVTYWAHKKWNKIASDIKLVFYSSTITMMHGPINIRFMNLCLVLDTSAFHKSLKCYGSWIWSAYFLHFTNHHSKAPLNDTLHIFSFSTINSRCCKTVMLSIHTALYCILPHVNDR